MKYSFRLKMIKEQRIGFFVLVGFILLLEVYLHYDIFFENEVEIQELPAHLIPDASVALAGNDYVLEMFDPNEYHVEDWKKIGFSEKQAQTIIRYKNSLGGKFSSKEQLKKCFVIDARKYEELEPFIDVKKKYFSEHTTNKPEFLKTRKPLDFFDPNLCTLADWQKIGFSDKQALIILKYKNSLGGFKTKEDLSKCYVISKEKFSEIAPFVKISLQDSRRKQDNGKKEKKDLNSVEYQVLQPYVFNETLSKRVVNFRTALGGFISYNQLKEVYGITPEIIENLRGGFVLDSSKIKRINLSNASEEDLQKHIYFRKYKRKIIEFRESGKNPKEAISEKDDKYYLIIRYLQ